MSHCQIGIVDPLHEASQMKKKKRNSQTSCTWALNFAKTWSNISYNMLKMWILHEMLIGNGRTKFNSHFTREEFKQCLMSVCNFKHHAFMAGATSQTGRTDFYRASNHNSRFQEFMKVYGCTLLSEPHWKYTFFFVYITSLFKSTQGK